MAAVADQRSFRRAAERLGYVQSAISRQVAYLEQLTGVRLVERSQGPKPVRLTPAGELLLGHANDILNSIDAAKRDFATADEIQPDVVRIGLFAGVPTRILPLALAAFGKRCPGIGVAAREAVSDAPLFDMLRKGSVDLAFASLPAEPGPFTVRELLRVPWVLVAPAGSEIARRTDGPPTAAEIARLPVIAIRAPRDQSWIEHRFPGPAGRPRIVIRCDTVETVQALAGAGVGVGVVPRLALNEHDPRTVAIDLGDMVPPAVFGLVWHDDRVLHGVQAEFREVVCRVCSHAEGDQPEFQRYARAAEPAPADRVT